MYGKCGYVDDACSAFQAIHVKNIYSWSFLLIAHSSSTTQAKEILDIMPQWNPVSWNVVLGETAHYGHPHPTKILFDLSPERDVVSWKALAFAFSNFGRLCESLSLFEKMPMTSLVSWNSIVSAYTRDGQIVSAREAFDRMPEHHVVSWNSAYAQEGRSRARRREELVERNHISWNSLLHAYVVAKKLDIPCRVFFRIPQWCINSWTSMLVGFYQAGDLEMASIWFERMLDRNVVSWNVMICANARSGDAHQALRLLKLILLMPPPVLSLNPCAAIPDLAQGKLIHSTIPGKIFLSDIRTPNAFISMYGNLVVWIKQWRFLQG
ncbi:pentatricopeptide repeat-containing protein At2g35030, mitochondrial-like [Selaginella moellendorffii]|uniref:pentatricopeptide repeat-containing protein At2g35030, mitochondrial-like n=1 Tax=Selaginella moellendorffii TaxID=88036 RepID=UPI000D1D00C9|nr:pentatricopeptide repeat-containing protein At2g35030, mitochondrial-like [Selaginella moellendorffii]|eukprot:XP_024524283.1 pentatricopeptide repeat-containing protein At2g35030, mitochondrial-like [Selaginella moellendorffii]